MHKTQRNSNSQIDRFQKFAENLAPLAEASGRYRKALNLFHNKLETLQIKVSELPVFNFFYSLKQFGGRDRRFAIKKAQNMALLPVIDENPGLVSAAQRSAWICCAHSLEFTLEAQAVMEEIDRYEDPDRVVELLKVKSFKKAMNSMRKRLMGTWFCRVRGCPTCDWRAWMVNAVDLKEVLSIWLKNRGHDISVGGRDAPLLFFTVTMENVEKDDLRGAVEGLLKKARFLGNKVFNWHDTERYPEWKFVRGFYRKLEITYNEENDTYHPHMHFILAVDTERYYHGDYFKTQQDYSDLWSRISGFGIVDIRVVKNLDDGVMEIAKYATKSSHYFPKNDPYTPRKNGEVWVAIKLATKGKQMFSYTGDLAEIRRELRHDKRSKKEEMNAMLSAGLSAEIIDHSHIVTLDYDHDSHDFRNY